SLNSRSHSAWLHGGSVPDSGAHSMIDRPEPVSRVAPPRATITRIMKQVANNHSDTSRRLRGVMSCVAAAACAGSNGMALHIGRAGAATGAAIQELARLERPATTWREV